MADENIPKDFEDLIKDVHWLNEADPKSLMMRLKVVEVLWYKLQQQLEKHGRNETPEEMLSLLILSGIIAAKIAPAVKLTSEELSQIIKAEGWDIPDLVKYLEKKL
jgi:hypothetical protein